MMFSSKVRMDKAYQGGEEKVNSFLIPPQSGRLKQIGSA